MRFRLRNMFLFTTAVALAVCIVFRWWPIDGIGGSLLSLIEEEDTVWADGYTDRAFRAAHVGMKRDEIYTLLGPPIDTWDYGGGQVFEWWSYSPADTNYRQREFVFQGDTAVEKISGYWID